jgi:hypothetical protein
MVNSGYRFFSFIAVVLFAFCCLPARLGAQAVQPASQPVSLNAALVLAPEFCATKTKKGTWGINQETFPVGKTACEELEPIIKTAFTSLRRVDDPAKAADAQLVLTPKFVDVGATQKMFAFSDRELTVLIEWTARDKSGKTVWIETIQGTAKRHMGNAFTHGSNVKHIVEDAVKDVGEQAVAKIEASPEIAKAGGPAAK